MVRTEKFERNGAHPPDKDEGKQGKEDARRHHRAVGDNAYKVRHRQLDQQAWQDVC